MIHSYNDLEKHLESLGLFHMKPGQDRMKIALENLNLFPLPYPCVQIVGTNGKGSTSTFLASLAKEHNLKTGLYTSPHFLSVKERILFQDKVVSDEIWLECAKKVYKANKDLTYFEFLTVLAALIYKELEVDIAFFEAGLGGKFDATTALQAEVVIFTPFDLDHTQVLGSTLKEIAKDKAHAMNKHTLFAYSAVQEDEARDEIINLCNELDIDCPFLTRQRNYKLGMNAPFQQGNAHLAVMAWRLICREILEIQSHRFFEEKALEKAFIPGRLQVIQAQNSPIKNSTFILDGAHNEHALTQLLPSLKNIDKLPSSIIFSCLDDKDLASILPLISKIAEAKKDCIIYVPTISNNPRSIESTELCDKIKKYYPHVVAFKKLDEILKNLENKQGKKEEECILICGSLYLLAEFYQLYPIYLTK